MPNYVPTGPFSNGIPPGINATFLNNVERVFKQISGGTETGKYFISTCAYVSSATLTQYVLTLSRTATPVSVAIDTTDSAPSACNAPTTAILTSNGFQIKTASTGVSATCNVGGNWTVTW